MAVQQQELTKERAECTSQERKSRDLLVKLHGLEKVTDDLTKAHTLMNECEAELEKHKRMMGKIDAAQEAKITHEQKIKELGLEEQTIKRQIGLMHEKVARLSKQTDMKRENAETDLDELRKNRQQIDKERLLVQKRIEDCEAETEAKALELDHLTLMHKQDVDKLREEYKSLFSKVTEYHKNLMVNLAETV